MKKGENNPYVVLSIAKIFWKEKTYGPRLLDLQPLCIHYHHHRLLRRQKAVESFIGRNY